MNENKFRLIVILILNFIFAWGGCYNDINNEVELLSKSSTIENENFSIENLNFERILISNFDECNKYSLMTKFYFDGGYGVIHVQFDSLNQIVEIENRVRCDAGVIGQIVKMYVGNDSYSISKGKIEIKKLLDDRSNNITLKITPSEILKVNSDRNGLLLKESINFKSFIIEESIKSYFVCEDDLREITRIEDMKCEQ